MKLTRLVAIAVIVGSIGIGAGQAQIREQQPAEFPPSSYKGKQYVDSNGCVFIRAGIDGDVSWVPRVTRDRKTVCGFKPTLATQVASAPEPAAKPATKPVQITLNTAAAPAPAPKPVTPRVTAKPRKPAPVVVRQAAPKPAPKPVARIVKAPVVVAPATQKTRQVASACPEASGISQQYLRGGSGLAVRCGPQTAPIVGVRRSTASASASVPAAAPQIAAPRPQVQSSGLRRHYAVAPAAQGGVTATTRIVPRHVAQRRAYARNLAVPQGYKKVWTDGRLNPKRAEQNLQGRNSMLLVWTQKVPRRLIDQQSGRDVTASVPLIYPYTDLATQRRELGEVTIVQRDGKRVKRIVRNPGVAPVLRQPVYSTRSAPKSVTAKPKAVAAPRALAGKQYVQIGKFNNAAKAQTAAQRVARMGMPARIGKHRKGGKTYMTVQAGPFNGASAMQSAMQRLRGAGYRDAFARN